MPAALTESGKSIEVVFLKDRAWIQEEAADVHELRMEGRNVRNYPSKAIILATRSFLVQSSYSVLARWLAGYLFEGGSDYCGKVLRPLGTTNSTQRRSSMLISSVMKLWAHG